MRLSLSIIWLVILAFAMLTPGDKFPEVDVFDFQDKLIHFVSFGLLSFLWAGIGVHSKFKNWLPSNWKQFLIFGFLPCILFEYGQLYIPNRTFDYFDLIVNILGCFAGLFAYFKIPLTSSRLD
ncbi:VanZ family protein [Algoriphagus sp. CAU 1675]|uniref:VanZ family protein n=1 Tax=Algoriphagus sp. CAU 1675 TaxID=3032597 RepID=UPI0023DCB037|nr:VanZ family protein [Algoriphagus sp. CAU 1675]MDF2157138.1 VanZ family protein [Algoriphagus sp. CAU 1675]